MLQLLLALALVGAFGYYLYRMYKREMNEVTNLGPGDNGGGEPGLA